MKLNYFPINFEFDTYQITQLPYADNKLQELRQQYNATHSFFRNGDFIYASNKENNADLNLGVTVSKEVHDSTGLTSSLIKHVFFRTFKERFPNYVPVDFYPFRFFSAKETDDIIRQHLPAELQDKIAYKKVIELQLRSTEINGIKRHGFIVNTKRTWMFNISCDVLYREGFNLTGLDVLHVESLPGMTNILAPNEEFIGTFQHVTGSKASVKTNEGVKEYELSELTIRKTKFNIEAYLLHKAGKEVSEKVLKIIETKRADIYNAKAQYTEIIHIAKSLFSHSNAPVSFQNKDGFAFTVSTDPIIASNTIELKTPAFLFDHGGTKTHTIADQGLMNYGPYDSLNFDIKSPRVLCLCHRAQRGQFTKFLSNLKDGIPQSRFFTKGLLKKYDLREIQFEIQEIPDYLEMSYLTTLKTALEETYDFAIIEIPGSFKKLEDQNNPYYRIKAKLLGLEIPVQYVTSEIVRTYNEYILNSMALQIYAKLGGVPWVLPSQTSVDREIVIGIGHSWIRANAFKGAASNRVVGITTFLRSDGQYILGEKVKDVDFEHYFSELLASLKGSIKRISSEQGWKEGETVRLIFHIFKPIKNTEFDVISQLVRDITEYKIRFAFVTISKVHPYLLFEPNQPPVSANTTKGEFIPKRGSNIFLDPESCVVQMIGPTELKTPRHAMSTPILIRIRTPKGNSEHANIAQLLYYDLSYITQQIFAFTYLSWRSFLPNEQPATMLYSDLISNLLGKLRNVPEWDADKLNSSLKAKKWFL